MAQITIKDPAGKDAGTVELDDSVFGIQPNVPVMHQVVTAQLARRRSGTQSTKTRSEVRGGGGKPYRQKGTGNARQGSTRAPHYSGGGIALGPKPRDYGQRTPKKMIRLALRSALSDRASEGRVLVVDRWAFDTPSTKSAKAALGALGVQGRVLVVVDRDDATSALSFRNLPEVQLIQPGELNAYDVLCNDWIVFTSANVGVVVNHEERAVAGTAPAYHADDPAEGLRDPAESATGDTEASATQDPAEGPRDEATDDAATGASATDQATGEAADEAPALTASAPDRSADEAGTGEGSASDHTPPAQESPERVSSEGDQPA